MAENASFYLNEAGTEQPAKGIQVLDAVTGDFWSSTHAMAVTAVITPSGTQDVNLTKVGGSAIAIGQGLMAASLPVVLASDQSSVSVKQATASNLNAAVVGLGTAGTPAGGVLTVQGVASGTSQNVTPDSVMDAVTTTASVTSATTVLTFTAAQLQGMGYIAFGFTSVGSGNTIVVDAAADGSTYNASVAFVRADAAGASLVTSTAPATSQQYVVPVSAQAMRIRVSVYGSGTITAYGTLKRGSVPGITVNAVVTAGNTTGNAASAATDSGNPVKIGGKFNTTAPTVTDGQRVDFQANNRGAQLMEAGPFIRGYATADTQIKGSAGFIHTIAIAPTTATPTAGLLTIYDSLTETGTVMYSEWVFATTQGHSITLNLPCGTGIYAGFDATLANVNVTISYR